MERLVIPTTNLQITVVDHSSRSPTAKIHNILTINPAQIVLLSLRSMMITTIGSNISLTPACHLLILFSRILQKLEPASLQGNLSALTPDKFKNDLLRSGTNDDELEDMKTYLKECSIYGKKHRISLLATATGFFHDYYFSNASFRASAKTSRNAKKVSQSARLLLVDLAGLPTSRSEVSLQEVRDRPSAYLETSLEYLSICFFALVSLFLLLLAIDPSLATYISTRPSTSGRPVL